VLPIRAAASLRTYKRIFEPYFTTKAKDTGTGLGLATAHGIINNHGGSIRFESRKNKGTTFHVYLSRVETQHKDLVFDGRQTSASVHECLLFVDDQTALLEIGQKLLENLGYEVTAKKCPQKALEAFQNAPDQFDMVITDLSMKKNDRGNADRKNTGHPEEYPYYPLILTLISGLPCNSIPFFSKLS
jgi:Histidine kinase-, DNA gyrase B-, and HSP90-like ATPase